MTFSPTNGSPEPDDLDRLLSTTLPKVLPDPFPAFQYPAETPQRGVGLDLSRATLALCAVGLLGLGLLLVPRQLTQNGNTQPGEQGLFQNSTADGRELLQRMNLEKAEAK